MNFIQKASISWVFYLDKRAFFWYRSELLDVCHGGHFEQDFDNRENEKSSPAGEVERHGSRNGG